MLHVARNLLFSLLYAAPLYVCTTVYPFYHWTFGFPVWSCNAAAVDIIVLLVHICEVYVCPVVVHVVEQFFKVMFQLIFLSMQCRILFLLHILTNT